MKKKIFSKLAASVLSLSIFIASIPAVAATPDAASITGASSTTSTLASGVMYTKAVANSSSVYGNRLINVVEADLSSTNLYMGTVYSGSNAVLTGTETVSDMVQTYASTSGNTPVAAINGDLWWTAANTSLEPANNNNYLLRSGASNLPMSLGFSTLS